MKASIRVVMASVVVLWMAGVALAAPEPDPAGAGKEEGKPTQAAKADGDGIRRGKYELGREWVSAEVAEKVYGLYREKPGGYSKSVKRGEAPEAKEPEKAAASWSVYVPADYQPQTPYGLFVWVRSAEAKYPRDHQLMSNWHPIFDKHRMIMISAYKSGNDIDVPWRQTLAVEGTRLMRQMYNIDPQRIYIAGMSGGGRLCSQAAVFHPDIFVGALPMQGMNYYRDLMLTNKAFYPGFWPNADKRMLDLCRRSTRWYIFEGSKDHNQPFSKQFAEEMKKEGFKYVTYEEVPGMGHSTANADQLDKAIQTMDAPLAAEAKTLFDDAAKQARVGDLGKAMHSYTLAALRGGEQPFVKDAQAKAQELRSQYTQELEEIREAAAGGDRAGAIKQLVQFRKTWNAEKSEEVKALMAEIQKSKPKPPAASQ
jgi:predicted esterase